MYALRRGLLRPSGVEFAASLNLTPSTRSSNPDNETFTATQEVSKVFCNLIVARTNILRIYEIREEPAPVLRSNGHGKDRRSRVRKDTEAVEGEVEMDTQGEGFVNMGAVKSASTNTHQAVRMRLHFVREHLLHGIVTGLEGVKTISTTSDGLDRLLVSFKDAKIALMEWSDTSHDLVTISIHTYERAPQLLSLGSSTFHSYLRADPNSLCAALVLPNDFVAVIPFFHGQAELDMMDQDQGQSLSNEIPYSPSFILHLPSEVDERITNVIDIVFLSGFNDPTVAVLCQTQETWTGRLKEFKDTVNVFILTLDAVTRNYSIITVADGLPHDCRTLLACDPSLSGVVILSPNAIIHVDQAGRKVVLPVNGWLSRISDVVIQPLRPEEQNRDLHLEGSVAAFVDERTFFVILKDGSTYPVEVISDGRTVSRLVLGTALAQSTIPSVISNVGNNLLFVGSIVGASVLLRADRVEQEIQSDSMDEDLAPAVVDPTPKIDIDDEDDIYADIKESAQPSGSSLANGHAAIEKRFVIHLSLNHYLPGYGNIADMTMSLTRNGERPVAELVAATGVGHLGGFTLFQRDLPTRVKRKIHAIGGTRGIWSMPIKQPIRVSGSTSGRDAEVDSIIMSTDANPSPGLSRIAIRSGKADINITTRLTATTIGAAPFFQRTAILHVVTDAIRVLEPGLSLMQVINRPIAYMTGKDGTERQIIKDMDGNMKRPKIRYCSISDPFILILREDDSLGLFVGNAETGKIRRKDMTPLGEKISRYSCGCFCSDPSGVFRLDASGKGTAANTNGNFGQASNVTSSLESTVDNKRGSQWLLICRPQGVVEIWTLPKLSMVFSTSVINTLPSVLVDSFDPPALSLPQDPPRKPEEFDIEQISLTQLGESAPQPHLMVLSRSGQAVIYEAIFAKSIPIDDATPRRATLSVQFVRVASCVFETRSSEEPEKPHLLDFKRPSRNFIPFITHPSGETSLSGVFLTGDQPRWILRTDVHGVKIHTCTYSVVHAFTACSLWESKGDFLMYTDEGPCLLEWMPGVNVGTELPSRNKPRFRSYSHTVFDSSTGLIVAVSSLPSKFALFDEDGERVWEPDRPDIDYPMAETSTLELISPDFTYTMDGYEFQSNEFVNALECVSLETLSTDSGTKDFIAIGTTINRGEDLAVKGATYVFEIIEVVPDPDLVPQRSYKLRLHCRDEAKGPVSAVCGMDGYLVSSAGQKLFVRAFEMDERLVGVAFLDIGVYVTSLRTLKNLMIIGDAVKSVWLIAFQEDPFKLVILGKDIQRTCISTADFFFTSGGYFRIAAGDEDGISRLFEYDPYDPESRNGQTLLCRTEFNSQTDSKTSISLAYRNDLEDDLIPQAQLLYGASDGSISMMIPIDESTYKVMQLVQGQLTRNVQHVAGLNPKAFRIVQNDYVSKPLSQGIIDGDLLSSFEYLSVSRQQEMTRQIGTDRGTVLEQWLSVLKPW